MLHFMRQSGSYLAGHSSFGLTPLVGPAPVRVSNVHEGTIRGACGPGRALPQASSDPTRAEAAQSAWGSGFTPFAVTLPQVRAYSAGVR